MTRMSFSQHLKPRFSLETIAALLVIAFGLALRLRQYTLNLSFWLDEAMLALNIVQRSFGELIRPLDYDQGAPLGFLWSIKLAQVLLGDREYSLRLLPFLMGCLALPLLWLLARQLTRPVGLVFALLIFASSRYLVSYGAQVKQYAVDVSVALLLYLLALRLLRKETSAGGYWFLALCGGLSIWVSHAAVFSLGGIGLTLMGARALQKDWRAAFNYGLCAAFWVLNFAALYFIQYRSLASNAYLTNFWAEYFAPLSFSALSWVPDRLGGLFYIPGGLSVSAPAWLLLVLFLLGTISLLRRRQAWIWMFILSLLFTLAASGLGKYPFGGRMGIFAVPGLLICAGEGIEALRALLPFGKGRVSIGLVLSILLVGYLTITPLTFALESAFKPKMAENIAPTMAYLKANWREGDVIYLYRMSIPAFRYYAPRYELEGRFALVVDGTDAHENRAAYQAELAQLAGSRRVWFLFSHMTDYEYVDDRDAILAYAGQLGEKKREFSQPGTFINLYLYDLAPR